MTDERKDGDCALGAQGRPPGACAVEAGGREGPACRTTLRESPRGLERLIKSVHLSRPENYLSLYQSGCNFTCRKCHSWTFSKVADGDWMSVEDLVAACGSYEAQVTLVEPRARATAYHAHDSCHCCGSCALTGRRSASCPGVLDRSQIGLSPQGFGPARNVVAFTGGDVMCRPRFYADVARRVKEETDLWVLLETNGWGLTPGNLDCLAEAGVDAFWLDIKAFEEDAHRWLTGCTNRWILDLPREIVARGFVLEVLSLYIPGLVEADQLGRIAETVARAGTGIPFTVLAFFPEYEMKEVRCPKVDEMLAALGKAREAGLENVRLGNLGVFARSEEDLERVRAAMSEVGRS